MVSNAIKFTDRGSVTLTVYPLPVPGTLTRLCFSVKDTGMGMDAEQQQRLFTPFAQADASITRRFGGTGLGLSIVKRLTELMGGEVQVDSAIGQGSEFRVLLDFAEVLVRSPMPLVALPATLQVHALRGVHVLVVDDSSINRDVARRILELEGATVSLATNGLEALGLLGEATNTVDLVLMDIQMPVMDGLEATERIRHQLKRKDLPVIALTAGALSSERDRAFAAQMNDFITKPFDAKQLVQSILRHVAVHPPLASVPSQPPAISHWPDIAGIDASDVRGRLGNDLSLFQNLLRRMLQEFAQLLPPADTTDAGLADFGRRMHKLKGGAGNLGAKAIQQAADQVELACTSGQHELLAGLVQGLAAQLQSLQQAAAPVLRAKLADSAQERSTPAPTVSDADLLELVQRLQRQELSAVGRFHALRAPLTQLLGPTAYASALSDVQGLRFHAAAATLKTYLT